jgi:hypothetical protein
MFILQARKPKVPEDKEILGPKSRGPNLDWLDQELEAKGSKKEQNES